MLGVKGVNNILRLCVTLCATLVNNTSNHLSYLDRAEYYTFIHLADASIQSDLQMRNTASLIIQQYLLQHMMPFQV